MIITLVCADNAVSRNGIRWKAEDIRKMPDVLGGKVVKRPATKNHNWDGVAEIWGRVIEGRAVSDQPPTDIEPINANAIATEGYWYCEIDIAVLDQSLTEAIATGLLSENSIGFSYGGVMCGNCTCEAQNYFSRECKNYWGDIPYLDRTSIEEIFEVSFVLIPAQHYARLTKINGQAVL